MLSNLSSFFSCLFFVPSQEKTFQSFFPPFSTMGEKKNLFSEFFGMKMVVLVEHFFVLFHFFSQIDDQRKKKRLVTQPVFPGKKKLLLHSPELFLRDASSRHNFSVEKRAISIFPLKIEGGTTRISNFFFR